MVQMGKKWQIISMINKNRKTSIKVALPFSMSPLDSSVWYQRGNIRPRGACDFVVFAAIMALT